MSLLYIDIGGGIGPNWQELQEGQVRACQSRGN